MKEEKIASIVFEPICTRCAGFVYGKVDCEELRIAGNPVRVISPERCPQCGARFDMIVVPKRFPVEMSKFIQDREKPESGGYDRITTKVVEWNDCTYRFSL